MVRKDASHVGSQCGRIIAKERDTAFLLYEFMPKEEGGLDHLGCTLSRDLSPRLMIMTLSGDAAREPIVPNGKDSYREVSSLESQGRLLRYLCKFAVPPSYEDGRGLTIYRFKGWREMSRLHFHTRRSHF